MAFLKSLGKAALGAGMGAIGGMGKMGRLGGAISGAIGALGKGRGGGAAGGTGGTTIAGRPPSPVGGPTGPLGTPDIMSTGYGGGQINVSDILRRRQAGGARPARRSISSRAMGGKR